MIERLTRSRRALALAAVLLLAGCGDDPGPLPPRSPAGFPTGTLVVETAGGEEVRIDVEIAETVHQRVQGLRERRELAPDAGMVFLPDVPQRQAFVMEDTLIPLSVAWWDERGRILGIRDMTPCREDPCRLYDIGVVSAGAVEVNRGFFEDRGVEVGDRVRLERPGG